MFRPLCRAPMSLPFITEPKWRGLSCIQLCVYNTCSIYTYIQYLYAHKIFKVGESVNFTAWEIVVGELVTGEVMLGNLPSNI